MAIRARDILKAWFETGDKPTQSQFWDWIDSFWHMTDTIPQASIENLGTTLDSFALQTEVDALKAITLTVVAPATSASVNLPAGTILHKVRTKSNAAINYNLGTSVGGNQIIAAQAVAANTVDIVTVDWDIEVLTTIHFSGLSGTTNIKLYLLQ